MSEPVIDTADSSSAISRFGSDGYCRAACIDRIAQFFGRDLPERHAVERVRGTLASMNLFAQLNLQVRLLLPPPLIISPTFIRIALSAFGSISFNKGVFEDYLRGQNRCAVMHHLTFSQLYALPQRYTHCVVEFYRDGRQDYFDGLLDQLKREMIGLYNYRQPQHAALMAGFGPKILVWE